MSRPPSRLAEARKAKLGTDAAVLTAGRGENGFGLAVARQFLLLPVFGLHPAPGRSLNIGAGFKRLSLARSYGLWRLLVQLRSKGTG